MRFAATVAGTGIGLIGRDHAGEHGQQRFAFGKREWCQQSFLCSQQGWTQPASQLGTTSRQSKHACPPISRMNPLVDKPFRIESVDHLADAHRIDAKAVRQLALTASRPLVQVGHDGVDQRSQTFTFENFGSHPKTYLMEASRQMAGNTMRQRDRCARRRRCLWHLPGSERHREASPRNHAYFYNKKTFYLQ